MDHSFLLNKMLYLLILIGQRERGTCIDIVILKKFKASVRQAYISYQAMQCSKKRGGECWFKTLFDSHIEVCFMSKSHFIDFQKTAKVPVFMTQKTRNSGGRIQNSTLYFVAQIRCLI